MRVLYQSFLLLIARATHKELAKYIEFLKAENRILRDRLPKRIAVTPRERRTLIKFGKPIGAAIRGLITIVSPRTFLRWLHDDSEPPKVKRRKPGRPRTGESIRQIVIRLATENG